MAEASPCRGRRWRRMGCGFLLNIASVWTHSTRTCARGHELSIATLAIADNLLASKLLQPTRSRTSKLHKLKPFRRRRAIRNSKRSAAQLSSASGRQERNNYSKARKIKNPRSIRRHRRPRQGEALAIRVVLKFFFYPYFFSMILTWWGACGACLLTFWTVWDAHGVRLLLFLTWRGRAGGGWLLLYLIGVGLKRGLLDGSPLWVCNLWD